MQLHVILAIVPILAVAGLYVFGRISQMALAIACSFALLTLLAAHLGRVDDNASFGCRVSDVTHTRNGLTARQLVLLQPPQKQLERIDVVVRAAALPSFTPYYRAGFARGWLDILGWWVAWALLVGITLAARRSRITKRRPSPLVLITLAIVACVWLWSAVRGAPGTLRIQHTISGNYPTALATMEPLPPELWQAFYENSQTRDQTLRLRIGPVPEAPPARAHEIPILGSAEFDLRLTRSDIDEAQMLIELSAYIQWYAFGRILHERLAAAGDTEKLAFLEDVHGAFRRHAPFPPWLFDHLEQR